MLECFASNASEALRSPSESFVKAVHGVPTYAVHEVGVSVHRLRDGRMAQ